MGYKIEATCPCCGKKAEGKDQIEEFFGWRRINDDKTIPQSYCRTCRNAKCAKGSPKH